MISVQEAKALVAAHCRPLPARFASLEQAPAHTLAQDVVAPVDVPAFRQAAMDGYCFCFAEYDASKGLVITGEIQAGVAVSAVWQPGSALRIFTGAALPPGADTVVMQEKVTVQDGRLFVHDGQLRQGIHVKAAGSEIGKGASALAADTLLTPAAIGFLASMGIAGVQVYPRPRVAIVVTGNEIRQPGAHLQTGQVYDANSFSLKAALAELGIHQVTIVYAEDTLTALQPLLQQALEQGDVILLSGGISAGDYDCVLEAARACGVKRLFHKVNQKPGKPLYFGIKEGKPVFGLPGNPAAALTCFYAYVLPALARLSAQPHWIRTRQLPLAEDYSKPAGKAVFLKGWYDHYAVSILPGQESYRLRSFSLANCLVYLDESITVAGKNTLVEVQMLPHG